MKKLLSFIAMAFLGAGAFAQTLCENGYAGIYECDKVDLMATMSIEEVGGGFNLNDIWGWTDSITGKEYALLGRSDGTSFIDVSDPINPVLIGNLPSHWGVNNLWRDIKVYNNHAFIVSEDHGMQVFDLSLLGEVTVPPATFEELAYDGDFSHAHNIVINEETGFAYAVGTDTFGGGLHVIDISDPANPTLAGGYADSGYTHDAQVVVYHGPDPDYQNMEIAFACNGGSGVFIVNCEDKTDMVEISGTSYNNVSYTHQGWLTEDQRFFLFNDEGDEIDFDFNTHTHILNVEDLDNPVYVGYFELSAYSTDHNLYIRNNVAFMSNYSSGLRIVGLSGIAGGTLEELGFFDTFPDATVPGYDGTWSNYPYFESGNVILSNFGGFFVLRPAPEFMTGLAEQELEAQDFTLFPNPAEESITLSLSRSVSGEHFEVIDVLGKVVMTNLSMPQGLSQITLDISSLKSGYYQLKMIGNTPLSRPFIKM